VGHWPLSVATNGVALRPCPQFRASRRSLSTETFEMLGTALLPGASDMDVVQPASQGGRQKHKWCQFHRIAAGSGSPFVGGVFEKVIALPAYLQPGKRLFSWMARFPGCL